MKFESIPNQLFSFKFNNDREEKAYYDVVVTINTIREDKYYEIKYQYLFRKDTYEDPKYIKHYKTVMHPFYLRGGLTQYNCVGDSDNISGAMVYKNPITTSMIRLLSMTDSELQEHCGHFSTQKYRQNIMISLCYL
uniref:Uncharacterized protein n=1 Tax=viral metagenome TaxID=1070528 RepID=A0A6C0CM19_9ZZZZ